MKGLIALGLVLLLAGGGLMIWGAIPHEEKHSTNVLGLELSVTEKTEKKVPVAVSGTLLAVGAALVVIGALKKKPA